MVGHETLGAGGSPSDVEALRVAYVPEAIRYSASIHPLPGRLSHGVQTRAWRGRELLPDCSNGLEDAMRPSYIVPLFGSISVWWNIGPELDSGSAYQHAAINPGDSPLFRGNLRVRYAAGPSTRARRRAGDELHVHDMRALASAPRTSWPPRRSPPPRGHRRARTPPPSSP